MIKINYHFNEIYRRKLSYMQWKEDFLRKFYSDTFQSDRLVCVETDSRTCVPALQTSDCNRNTLCKGARKDMI